MKRRTKRLLLAATFLVLIAGIVSIGSRPRPAGATSSFGATAITSGVEHNCALVSGGAVKCWGINNSGELGDGTTTDRYTPVSVCLTGTGQSCSPLTNVLTLQQGPAAGHTCATWTWGIALCWGWNADGQLGRGTTGGLGLNPAAVLCSGASSYCNSTYHFLAGISSIGAGNQHTCALDIGGNVWCWGSNNDGQLGDGTRTDRNYAARVCVSGMGTDCSGGSPLSGVTAIAIGDHFSCALLNTDPTTVKCWGNNGQGELGNGQTASITPAGCAQDQFGTLYCTTPTAVCATGAQAPCSSYLTGVTAIAAGGYASIFPGFACALIGNPGTVKCWGSNKYGELGDGTLNDRNEPVDVSGLSNVVSVSAAGQHACAVVSSTDKLLYCWGWNPYGEIGIGSRLPSTIKVPAAVICGFGGSCSSSQLGPVISVSGGYAHTCAVLSDSSAKCWGWNVVGQLGDGGTCCDDPPGTPGAEEHYNPYPHTVHN